MFVRLIQECTSPNLAMLLIVYVKMDFVLREFSLHSGLGEVIRQVNKKKSVHYCTFHPVIVQTKERDLKFEP